MEIRICKDRYELGKSAAAYTAALINQTIEEKGSARIALSTGASQFDTIAALIEEKVDWSRVEMFHLDEYMDLPETHPASFRLYLREKFTSKVKLGAVHFVEGTRENMAEISREILKSPIDVGLIGIGENSHIAFNDPPANFDVEDPYIVVALNDTCKKQQVGEGWFKNVDETYKQAISMTCKRIMACKSIISVVPYKVKAEAIYNTLTRELTPEVPATLLKEHSDCTVYCDADSASMLSAEIIEKFR